MSDQLSSMDIHADRMISVRERLIFEADKKRKKDHSEPLYLESAFEKLHVREYRGKRLFDITAGIFGMVAFLLLTPFIALGIKLSSRGPVFFKQTRTGKNGIPFTCYKFRTMYNVGRDEGSVDEPDITTKGDPRVFSFGKFLRFLNLDELPQILNVFKGDMSLVGPRPYPVDECAWWNSSFDDFFYRYAVRPGITGFAQVRGYRGGTLNEEHMRKRTDYDLIYVQKNSLLFDVKTIAQTVTQMVNLQTNGH
ncbi:MAG: sugar transferase [Balneolaceae bacterium]